jgi:acetyltransferase-like isoleucine patch superfamily enzyme
MPGKAGFYLRRLYYKKKMKSLGKNFIVDIGVNIDGCRYIEIGDNVRIDRDAIIITDKIEINDNSYSVKSSRFLEEHSTLIIEDEVRINARSSIYGYGGVKIEKFCVLSESTKIFSLTHIPNDINDPTKEIFIKHSNNYKDTPSLVSPVVIGENSFIGVNCVFFPGSLIGKNSFVAPSSIVKDQFDDNSYIDGNPAKKIKNRFI